MSAAICGSLKATVTAVGWPCATSSAKLGPESAPMGSRRPAGSRVAERTSVMRQKVRSSRPLVALTTNWPGRRCVRMRSSVGRRNSEGTTETTMSAAVTASQSPVTVEVRRERKSGKELRVFAGVRDLLRELRSCAPKAQPGDRRGGGARARWRFPRRRIRARQCGSCGCFRSQAGFRSVKQAADVRDGA